MRAAKSDCNHRAMAERKFWCEHGNNFINKWPVKGTMPIYKEEANIEKYQKWWDLSRHFMEWPFRMPKKKKQSGRTASKRNLNAAADYLNLNLSAYTPTAISLVVENSKPLFGWPFGRMASNLWARKSPFNAYSTHFTYTHTSHHIKSTGIYTNGKYTFFFLFLLTLSVVDIASFSATPSWYDL